MVEESDLSFSEAAALLGDLPGLLSRVDSDDQTGMALDISWVVDEEEEPFRERFPDTPYPEEGRTLLIELVWTGSGTTRWDMQKDFYGLLGKFAEETLFIHGTYETDSVVYDVLTGSLKAVKKHAHHLRFRLTGPRVEFVLSPRFMPRGKPGTPPESRAPS